MPPARRGRGVYLGFFIAGGVFSVLTVVVLLLVAVAVGNAETDSDRQAAGFFLTAAVIPCGLAILFLAVGLIVLVATHQRR